MIRWFLYTITFGLVLYLANYSYVHLGLYHEDIEKCNAQLVLKFDSTLQQKNIIYFGESSNFTYHENDSCKKSISELVECIDSTYKILTISKGAIHAHTYKKFIQRLGKNTSIKAIIVTVNLRSFGINWIESDLETNLSRANIFYTNYPPLLKKFMLSFKAYDNKETFQRNEIIKYHYKNDEFVLKTKPYTNIRDWDKVVFHEGIKDLNGTKDQKATEVACHFIKNYAFRLNELNPRIKDLDDIVALCKRNNIQLIYNLLPENFEKARRFFGDDLVALMKENVTFLKKRYSSNTWFIDGSESLCDSLFIDKNWPTEHYVFEGRLSVANSIAERLEKINNQ